MSPLSLSPKTRWQFSAFAAVIILTVVGIYFWHISKADKDGDPIESIAVLPFENRNYLSDGITECLINNLSQLPTLTKVISYSSVSRYVSTHSTNLPDNTTIAHDLNVRALLIGTYEQTNDILIINIELIDTKDNRQIWGDRYVKQLSNIFETQIQISEAVTEKLRSRLTGSQRMQISRHPTDSIPAIQSYERGRSYVHLATRENLFDAIRYYNEAIREDKNYALPYVGLAEAYASLGLRGYISPSKGRTESTNAALNAISLNENLPEAHVAVALSGMEFAPYDFVISDRELRRAIELSPNLAVAHQHLAISLIKQGRVDEALKEALKARDLDPFSAVIAKNVALCYEVKRDYKQAIETLRQARKLGPPLSSTFEIGIYIQNHLYDEALAELAEQKKARESDPLLIYGTGMIYAAQGKRMQALQVIKQLENIPGMNFSQVHWIAKIYATLGEKDKALAALKRGLDTGGVGAFYKDEPVWDTIRDDPRFVDLLQQMHVM